MNHYVNIISLFLLISICVYLFSLREYNHMICIIAKHKSKISLEILY